MIFFLKEHSLKIGEQLIVITALIFILPSCLIDPTINTLVKELPNNRHTKKAILFLKEGGATLADSYQVKVCDINQSLDKEEAGNTFIVDEDHGVTKLYPTSINFNWISDDSLQIDYDEKLRTFIQEKKVEGVGISYKARR